MTRKTEVPKIKLFEGEKLLVILGLLGFALSAVAAIYIGMFGAIVLPEGNLDRAVSFDAAIAMFFLSIAAILPISGLSSHKRARIRWFFIPTALYSYAIETIQHFRGFNPRFSRSGSIADAIFGGLFGLASLWIIIVTVMLAIAFFRNSRQNERPFMTLGIRYAFISTMIAFVSGICMIILQSRYTGPAGNLIVLHGLGFHALQALPLLGWLLERAKYRDEKRARRHIHMGSAAWILCIVLICIQTALGRSVFELSTLPFLAGMTLLVWLAVIVAAAKGLLNPSIEPLFSEKEKVNNE